MESDLICKSELKEKYSLTESMIKDIPITTTKVNPYYKCAAPMKLYSKETVEEYLNSDVYKSKIATANKRKEAAKTKYQKNMIELEEHLKSIKVKVIDEDKLIQRTIGDKNDWYNVQNTIRRDNSFSKITIESVDKDTMDRWIVNYIRHNLTSYDKCIENFINKKVGHSDLYMKLKTYILDKIAEAYPKYKDECEIQKDQDLLGF